MARHTLTIAIYQESTGWELPDAQVSLIRNAARESGADLAVTAVSTTAQLIAAMPNTTMLIGMPLTAAQFRLHGDAVRFVQLTESLSESAGALIERIPEGMRVATAAGIRGPFVAEHALALTLAMVRRLDGALRSQAEHRWAAGDLAPLMRSLRGQTVGVVATDVVGDEITTRLRPFGVRIVQTMADEAAARDAADAAASRIAATTPDASTVEYVALDETRHVLPRCNVLIIALPTTPRTLGFFDRRMLDRLPGDAVIIDVTRGGVIEPNGLIQALRPKAGRLGREHDRVMPASASRAPNALRPDRGEAGRRPTRTPAGAPRARTARTARVSMRLLNAFRARDAQARNPLAYRAGAEVRAAAIDGFETRPLPAASPFWTMPNVVVSPGIAAAGRSYWDHACGVIAQNVRRYLEQHPTPEDSTNAAAAAEPLRDELTPAWYHGDAASTPGD
jgi:phosphoglycerate dehydrogenase-like enzyme